jgi:hypothetical protein
MPGPLSAVFRRRLEMLRDAAPDVRLPVIITLQAGAAAADVAATGMTITRQIADPPLVMGTTTPAQALAAARSATVVQIELDEPDMRA